MYDPEYLKVIEPMVKAAAANPPPQPTNCLEVRAVFEALITHLHPSSVKRSFRETRIDVPGRNGHVVPLYRFATAEQLARGQNKPQPAVLYIHGGGMICATVPLYSDTLARQTAEFDVQHFAVDYRRAPEASATDLMDDCYAALAYMSGHAAELKIDPARIAIAGDSAGGGLATGLALMARDRALQPPPAKLIAIYSMLDDRTVQRHPPKGAAGFAPPGTSIADDDAWPKRSALTWNTEMNAMGWAAYLGFGSPGKDGPIEAASALIKATASSSPVALPSSITPYSVPARVDNLAGLPSTYIEIGSLDLFAEEAVAFAAKLLRDNVDVELRLLSGLPHAYDLMAPAVTAVKAARETQKRAYNSF
ncbi:arylesterase monooxygenase [Grosmannia clavigera kw1407]|uniref:Arylesterase monooxygenase n=1 Tax=Grosmannia clavigera (strain kw1407 / UAMH 11150) TaxID=655863 RepID=F0XKW9_GROCL|nr:arylesterase monooxygenase [Grosmannia clavigera kw1407]EFX01603.1 arylesterase monooxygenase [Grosmannia clavigera kw1407]